MTIFLILFSLTFNLDAQENLTLEKAIRIALENNYSVKLTKKDVEIAENNTAVGNSGFLPTVKVQT